MVKILMYYYETVDFKELIMLCKRTEVKLVGRCAFKTCLVLLILLAFLTGSTQLMGAEIESKSYSIAFPIDLIDYIPISLGIKCDVQQYDKAFSDFATKENEVRESRLKELVFAIHNNDVKKCQDMTFLMPGINEEEILKINEKVKMSVPGWRSWNFNDAIAGENLEKLKVFNQFYLGKKRVFTLGVKDTPAPRPMLSFLADAKGTLMWDVKHPVALQSLLGEVMRFEAVATPNVVPLENRKFDYEVAIPDTNDTEHVVYLEFNGEKYDFDVFSDTINSSEKPTDEVVSFFQKKYLMLSNGVDREVLGELYTDKSRAKYLQSIKEPVSEKYTEWLFNDWATAEKKVRFVIDAKPLYIVFYQRSSNTVLSYSYIIRDPKDAQLKLTNFNCSVFLDDLFLKLKFTDSKLKLLTAEDTSPK
jgi:hypothetical protein